MKISDILRMAADAFDQRAQGAVADPALQNRAELVDVEPTDGQDVVAVVSNQEPSTDPAGTTASGNDRAPEVFLPPLQQKQELLKKAVGVENVYDDGTAVEQQENKQASEDDMSAEREDIVDRIKQLSGVPKAAIQELSNDEVFDD